MPSLSKQFNLEITVEQFLNACSLLELQELDLLIGGAIERAKFKAHQPEIERGITAGAAGAALRKLSAADFDIDNIDSHE